MFRPTCPGSPGTGALPEKAPNSPDELTLLVQGLDAEAFEIGLEADVGVESGRVLVEMEERSSLPVEDTALLLGQAVDLAQSTQPGLKLVEGSRCRVAHVARLEPGAPERAHSQESEDALQRRFGGRVGAPVYGWGHG